MHCPNCGTQVSTEQKFCRSCGLELQAIARLVTQQQAERTGLVTAYSETVRSAWVYRFIFGGACVSALGLMLLIVNGVLGIDRIINLPAMLLILFGALLALYGVLMPKLHPSKPLPLPSRQAELPAAETTSKLALAAGVEPVASVVEHTTRMLEPVAAKSGDLA